MSEPRVLNRTISNVVDEIEEWMHPRGNEPMYSVVAFFTNKELLKATKKDRDKAIELQGLLQEAVEHKQSFVVEQTGTAKSGAPKWKLLAFGPVDGPYTYSTLKDGQSVGAERVGGSEAVAPPNGNVRVSSQVPAPTSSKDEDIRKAVALKAAAIAAQGLDAKRIIAMADEFIPWLAASSTGTARSGSSAATEEGSTSLGPSSTDVDEGVANQGEGAAPSSRKRYADNPVPPAFGGGE